MCKFLWFVLAPDAFEYTGVEGYEINHRENLLLALSFPLLKRFYPT